MSSSLPCLADERDALLILVEARRLADEHEVRVRAPGAEDDLRAALRESAARARARLLRVLPERRCALDGIHRGPVYAAARMRHSSAPGSTSPRVREDASAPAPPSSAGAADGRSEHLLPPEVVRPADPERVGEGGEHEEHAPARGDQDSERLGGSCTRASGRSRRSRRSSRRRLACAGPPTDAFVAPCTANVESCFSTFAAPHSGQVTACSELRTSSSKCDSHSMHAYS